MRRTFMRELVRFADKRETAQATADPGVTSIRASGEALLTSAVILAAGSGASLSQSGQIITVSRSAGDLAALDEITLAATAASMTFSSISPAYRHLQVLAILRSTRAAANDELRLRVNGDSGANYDRQRLTGSGTTAAAQSLLGQTSAQIGTIPGATATADVAGGIVMVAWDYARTQWHKAWFGQSSHKEGTGTSDMISGIFSGFFLSTAAITSLTLFPAVGEFAAGSRAILYGYKGVA